MKEMIMIMLMGLMAGCASGAKEFVLPRDPSQYLPRARQYYEDHEYYYARQCAAAALAENRFSAEAQSLMGKILDKEIERQKENLIPRASEELSRDEAADEIKTWLERSEALLLKKQYDLALFAAEKVFLLDSMNSQASELIDRIKGQALKEGKAEVLFLNKMYEEEISERLIKYRGQARELYKNAQYGQAKFTIEKVLLLEPEDKPSLALYRELLAKEKEAR